MRESGETDVCGAVSVGTLSTWSPQADHDF